MKMAKQLRTEKRFFLVKCGLVAIALAGVGVFSGCGDSGGGSSSSVKVEASLSGLVSDNKGPIGAGKIDVKDASGMVVATTPFSDGKYSVKVPSNASYPIIITAYPDGGEEPVKAVVTSAIAERMDISPISSNIVDNAVALGGLSAENIAKASGGAIGMRQSQGVSAGAGGSAGGPGNSGGGAGKGGHAGHNMEDMKRSTSSDDDGQKQ